VSELEIWERQPSMIRNVDDGPPGGAGAGDPGGPTIDAKKRRRQTLGGVGVGDPGALTINAKKRRRWAPGGAGAEDLGAQCLRSPPLRQGGE
jgi:hypothetical protein